MGIIEFDGSWFPVSSKQVEDPEFAKLSPTMKVYNWLLISEFNYHKEFYRSDAWFAAALNCSLETIRKARPQLVKKGWIDIIPGTKTHGKTGRATQYLNVKHADPPENAFFAQMHRFGFERMLYLAQPFRGMAFDLTDVMVYVYLCYWEWMHRLQNEGEKTFFISKHDLRRLTGLTIETALNSIRRLHDNFTFSSGDHLFTYEVTYKAVRISRLERFVDPEQDQEVARQADEWREYVRDEAQRLQGKVIEKREKKTKAMIASGEEIDPQDLPKVFDMLYHQKYNKPANYQAHTKDKLIELGEMYGGNRLKRALELYMKAKDSQIKNRTRARTLTLAQFNANCSTFIEKAKMEG